MWSKFSTFGGIAKKPHTRFEKGIGTTGIEIQGTERDCKYITCLAGKPGLSATPAVIEVFAGIGSGSCAVRALGLPTYLAVEKEPDAAAVSMPF